MGQERGEAGIEESTTRESASAEVGATGFDHRDPARQLPRQISDTDVRSRRRPEPSGEGPRRRAGDEPGDSSKTRRHIIHPRLLAEYLSIGNRT